MLPLSRLSRRALVLAGIFLLPCCTFLSNRDYVERHPEYRGVRRVAVFLQRWPVYLQLPGQSDLGADFIKKRSLFFGAWEPAGQISPRAVDVEDISDALVAGILLEVLEKKGYEPFYAGCPLPGRPLTVEEAMGQYGAINRQVEGYLFCFYSPTLFVADARKTPRKHGKRSYGLAEIFQGLQRAGGTVVWAGPSASRAPKDSISHAFIYLSMTMFKALNWQALWQVADSQLGGRFRPWLPQCPPGPTDIDYKVDEAMVQRLMCKNLKCRLRHLIPDAF
jgi:hypothetical protein